MACKHEIWSVNKWYDLDWFRINKADLRGLAMVRGFSVMIVMDCYGTFMVFPMWSSWRIWQYGTETHEKCSGKWWCTLLDFGHEFPWKNCRNPRSLERSSQPISVSHQSHHIPSIWRWFFHWDLHMFFVFRPIPDSKKKTTALTTPTFRPKSSTGSALAFALSSTSVFSKRLGFQVVSRRAKRSSQFHHGQSKKTLPKFAFIKLTWECLHKDP